MALASNLGYPRMGRQRELKRATESYWQGKVSSEELLATARALRDAAYRAQVAAGISLVPCGDFSLYDHVLDMAVTVGCVPARHGGTGARSPLDVSFAMARGSAGATACEMTKWFDTNYHYIVPELGDGNFRLADQRPVDLYVEARALGLNAKPVLLGPVTFLLLGKKATRPLSRLLDSLVSVYADLLTLLARAGAKWVQMDEPSLVVDLSDEHRELYQTCYRRLADLTERPAIMVQTYFGALGENWDLARSLPTEGLGLDLIRDDGENAAAMARTRWPQRKVLGAGVVNGRNVWRADLRKALGTLTAVVDHVGSGDPIWVQPSCSLLHVPISVTAETGLDDEVRGWLAFADEKLGEVATLTRGLNEGAGAIAEQLAANDALFEARELSARLRHRPTRERAASLTEAHYRRKLPFAERAALQRQGLGLPLFPTTTIGSFPQTAEVRRMRHEFRGGRLGRDEYDRFIEKSIREAVRIQEEVGLDVLVHGEFERNDMVEYFGEQMACFSLTTAVARDDTQVHTHMCYSQFGDIIEAIAELDADVLSIENSRNDLELLEVFRTHRYDKGIGPGVYDVHSPRVPSVEEMADNLRRSAEVLSADQLWVNPDCGLKTRGWAETVASLRNIVAAARQLREEFRARS